MRILDIIREAFFHTYYGMIRVSFKNSTPTEVAELLRALPGVTTVTTTGDPRENQETYKIKLITQKTGKEAFAQLKQAAIKRYPVVKGLEVAEKTIVLFKKGN